METVFKVPFIQFLVAHVRIRQNFKSFSFDNSSKFDVQNDISI